MSLNLERSKNFIKQTTSQSGDLGFRLGQTFAVAVDGQRWDVGNASSLKLTSVNSAKVGKTRTSVVTCLAAQIQVQPAEMTVRMLADTSKASNLVKGIFSVEVSFEVTSKRKSSSHLQNSEVST